jgi:uncharacterized protein (TIGR03437 family)
MIRFALLLALTYACGFAAQLETVVSLPTGTVVTVLKLDAAGNLYVGGSIKPASPKAATDFTDAFVAKLSPDGSQTIFSTVLAGSLTDQVNDIAIAPDGTIHAIGSTGSTDFPTTSSALQTAFGTGDTKAFYARIDPKGAVAYSTFLGGATSTIPGQSVTLDSAGAVYLSGRETIITANPFVIKLDVAGHVVFQTSLTGGSRIALDAQSNIYVTGIVYSSSVIATTPGAFQPKVPSSSCPANVRDTPCRHPYVSKLDPTGQKLLYSTYLAGGGEESSIALAVDPQGNAYFAGTTTSLNFPITPGAYQTASVAGPFPPVNITGPGPGPDPTTGFITKLNPTGTALVFSTFLGGTASDAISAIALDSASNVYVAGSAVSQDFPGLSAVPLQCTGRSFVTRLSADGSSLSHTQLAYGVPGATVGALALDAAGNPWIADGAFLAHTNLFAAPHRVACATDSADFTVLTRIVPGQLISLFGNNLALANPQSANPPPGGNYPTSLGNVSVTFNGTPAPLLYVSPSQVNLQVPFEIAGQATAHMQIALQPSLGPTVESADFAIDARAPSVFVLESGTLFCGPVPITGQHPLAVNADGTINSCGNPAIRGTPVTIFFQGVGVTDPAQSTGAVTTAPQPLSLLLSSTNNPAFFRNAASVPGSISGIWSVQLQIPNGFSTSFTVGGTPIRDFNLIIWTK